MHQIGKISLPRLLMEKLHTIWQTNPFVHRRLSKSIHTWDKLNPDFRHIVLDDDGIDRFMRSNFDSRTYNAFNGMPLGVMKADMWRYAAIYVKGGVYADADASCLKPVTTWWNATACPLIVGMENQMHLCQWTFASVPRHPVLEHVIESIVRKVEEDGGVDILKRGDHFVHYYTGPTLFTEAVLRATKQLGVNLLKDLIDTSHEGVCFRSEDFFRGQNARNFYSSQFLPPKDSWLHQRERLTQMKRSKARQHTIS